MARPKWRARGPFVAANGGGAMLWVAPNKLLARQHFQDFRRAVSGFPVEVRQLSRFVSAKDAARLPA